MAEAEVLQEFLAKLGFKVDESAFKRFMGAGGVGGVNAAMLSIGKTLIATAAALETFVASFAAFSDNLYFVTQRTGATAESIRSIGYAAAQTGSSASEATSALESLGAAVRYNPAMSGLLMGLGVTKEHIGDAAKTFEDLKGTFRKMAAENHIWVAKNYADLLGIPDKVFLGMINKDMDKFEEQYKEILKKFGADTEDANAKTNEFMTEIRKLGAYAEAAAIKLFTLFEPTALQWLRDFEKLIEDILPYLEEFGEAIAKLASAFMGQFGWAVKGVGGFIKDLCQTSFKVLIDTLRIITSLLNGDWAEAWGGIKDVVGDVVGFLIRRITALITVLSNTALGRWVKRRLGIPDDAPTTDKDDIEGTRAFASDFSSGFKESLGLPNTDERQAAGDAPANAPRGIRNNNPGNLRAWGSQQLAGGFAKFNTAYEGLSALAEQMLIYNKRGWNSISAIVAHYAPSKDGNNEAAYRAALVKATGFGENQQLPLNNPEMLKRLMNGIVLHENGYNPYQPLVSQAAEARLNGGVTIHQTNNTVVHGASDPAAVGAAVGAAHGATNDSLVRNVRGVAT